MDHSSAVKLTGDSGSAVAAYQKASGAANAYTTAVSKSGKESDRLTVGMQRAAAATDKVAAAKTNADKATRRFAQAAQIAKTGVNDIAGAAIQAASAFGPWGAAIAVVGGALWGLVAAESEATKKSKELREELAKQQRSWELQNMDDKDAERAEYLRQKQRMRNDEDEAGRAATRRSIQFAIEDLEKKEARGGRGAEAARREIAELKALNAESLKDFDTARQIRHEEELRLIALENQVGAKKELVKLAGDDRSFDRALGFRGFSGNVAGENERRRFAAEARSGPLMRNNLTDPTEAAANSQAAQLRAIEVQRATTGESIDLINQEEQARLRLLEVQKQASIYAGERAEIDGQIAQVHHESELARIAQRQAAEEAAMAKRVEWADVSAGLASGAIATTNMAVAASGASAKKQEKIAGRLAGIQAMFVGGLEIVKSVAAFASLNIPQGIAHAAAGAFAFTQGALMLSGALPTGASGGGGSSAAMASEPTSAPSNGPSYNTGPIPGSPSPSAPSSSGTGGGTVNNNVISFAGANFYGTPDRKFVRTMHQELNQLGKHQRIGIGDR